MLSTARSAGIALIDELREDRRISSVEAQVLRAAIEDQGLVSRLDEPSVFDPGWITRERSSRGITQGQLAAAAGVSPQAVSQWEAGRTQPSLKSLEAIRALFERRAVTASGNFEPLKAQIEKLGGQQAFAAKIGMSQGNLSRVLGGKQPITGEAALAIEKATEGAVTRSQLRPDLWPEPFQVPGQPAI